MKYQVMQQHVDWPAGAGGSCMVRRSLTKEEADDLAKKCNEEEDISNPNSSSYINYFVAEDSDNA